MIINSRPILHDEYGTYSAFELVNGRKRIITMDGIVNLLEELAYRSKFMNEMCILWKTQFLKRMSVAEPNTD